MDIGQESFKVLPVSNGWVLYIPAEDEDSIPHTELFECPPGGMDALSPPREYKEYLSKARELLYAMLEELGIYYSKHNPYVLDIKVKRNPEFLGSMVDET